MLPPLQPMALPAAWTQPEMLIPFGGLLMAFGELLLATCQFLKSEIRDSETRLREELKASEARQREALLEVKGELRGLGGKLDRVLGGALAAKP